MERWKVSHSMKPAESRPGVLSSPKEILKGGQIKSHFPPPLMLTESLTKTKAAQSLVHLPSLVACKVLATNPTAQLPRRPHPPAKFHYSSWQERSPHPQPGLNKRPSDITSCQLQNSPGLPTSDHKVPGHAGPSGQDVQPVAPSTHSSN